jgi:hypothetical protein
VLSQCNWWQYSFPYQDIIRNNKVSLPSHLYSENQDEKINPKSIKYTNTDQLEKIYIKKPKPIITSKKIMKN